MPKSALGPLLGILFSFVATGTVTAQVKKPIRVGIYDNPPKVFINEAGQPSGFWPALTQAIAEREGWTIEWVPGTWSDNLTRLANNDIDVMVDVGITQAREQRFIFSQETVHVSWSRIYAAEDKTIDIIPDLQGKSIGGLENSFNLYGPEGIRDLLTSFDYQAEIVSFPTYEAMFAALERSSIDAGVTNKDFGDRMAPQYDIVKTPIIFQPAALHYAFNPDIPLTPYLRDQFDEHIRSLKADPDSVYYTLQAEWLGADDEQPPFIPRWLLWTLLGLLLLACLTILNIIILRQRIQARTRALQAEVEQHERTEAFRLALIDALPAHIALLDPQGEILDVNDQWRQFGAQNDLRTPNAALGGNYLRICDQARAAGVTEAAAVADGLRDLLAGRRETYTLEYPCHSPEHSAWFALMARRVRQTDHASPAGGAVVMHVDITERKQAELEMERLAYQDPLTGTASRNGLLERIAQDMDNGQLTAGTRVIMLDIRQLRAINDMHGYATGDEVLVQLGRRLMDRTGPTTEVARIGGDEFGLYIPYTSESAIEDEQAAIDGVFQEPLSIEGLAIEIEACFGYTVVGDASLSPEQLLREAELALFHARRGHAAGIWTAYSEALDQETRQRIELTQALRHALERDEFELHYQPKVQLHTGELIAAEALLRWNHQERGLQSPAMFIPLAEQSQLILPIGAWVLDEACRQLRQWQERGLPIVRIAVNVSVVQLAAGGLPATIQQALDRHAIAPSALSLEITESVFEDESHQLRQQLREIHALGVRLSLDDFGTGYSSLLYLQQYDFDEIKIDRGFVADLLTNEYSRNIVNTVVNLARGLDAEVVAEGVENARVHDTLVQLGCAIGQGYYYSMPLSGEDFSWLLAQHGRLPWSPDQAQHAD